ncbi:hypothetical protein AB8O64_11230 [Streptomyces sp. QH1-20]|uniref:hypothetical protein n=1 Tax=Streptomyces sp. QH1-20 TaxID=3240934 RepID=UPI003518986C
MGNALDARVEARRMAQLLDGYDRRLRALERTSQASLTSIEGGALEVYDKQGVLRGTVGVQEDGTVGVVTHNAPPPPTPTTPTVTPVLGGLLVTWDGQWANAYAAPLDFARVQVHVGTGPDFTPTAATAAATISDVAGGTTTVATSSYTPVWVRLVGVNTAEGAGAGSTAVSATPKQVDGPDLSALLDLAVWLKDASIPGTKLVAETIGADRLAANSVVAGKVAAGAIRARELAAGAVGAGQLSVGIGGNLCPDPGFETGYAASLATAPGFSIAADGNRSAHSLRVDPKPTTGHQILAYPQFPVSPGDRFWLAADYKVATDYTGGTLYVLLRWYAADGTWLSSSTIPIASPPADGVWKHVGATVLAPPHVASAELRLQVSTPTAGSVQFDNLEVRPVLSSGADGARAEIGPQGLRLYDNDGEEAVSLVTGRPNYLTLSNDGSPVATIDQGGNAGFQNITAAGTLTVGGDNLDTLLDRLPRGIIAQGTITSSVSTTGTEMGLMELAFTAEPARQYRVVLDCHANPSTPGGELQLRLRDGGASAPTVTSPQIQSAITPIAGPDWARVRLELVRSGAALGEGPHRLLATFANINGPSGQSMAVFGADYYPGTMYVEDVGPSITSTGTYNTGGASTKPAPQRYTKVYDATWSGSYADRGAYNSYYGTKMLQGYYSATNGMQASLVGFPSLGDLDGAVIIKAEVYLYFEFWSANAGGKAVIKAHHYAARPASFSSDPKSVTAPFARNEGRWIDITSEFVPSWFRGVALDPNNNASTYYGRARGFGETNAPRLRVTYTK